MHEVFRFYWWRLHVYILLLQTEYQKQRILKKDYYFNLNISNYSIFDDSIIAYNYVFFWTLNDRRDKSYFQFKINLPSSKWNQGFSVLLWDALRVVSSLLSIIFLRRKKYRIFPWVLKDKDTTDTPKSFSHSSQNREKPSSKLNGKRVYF